MLVTYATLGCGWLILKTDGALQRTMRWLMRPLTAALLVMIALVSVWTSLGQPAIAARWFASGQLAWFLPVPVLVVACAVGIFRGLRLEQQLTPFLLTLALCLLGFTGFVISIWPNIVPPSLTLWQAASSSSSQWFGLVGTVVTLPVILVYQALQYRVFKGKVREGDNGYH